jgi:hypothetical protein
MPGVWQVWLRYFLVWPGLPAIGDPTTADCVIVQAFGRNSCLDSRLSEISTRAQKRSDWQLVQELLAEGFSPGQPNFVLAYECMEAMNKFGLPTIVQWEVACAFPPEWYEKNHQKVICLWPPSSGYFSTRQVSLATLEVCRERGWLRVIEIAHKRMIARSALIVHKLWDGQMPVILFPQLTKSFDRKSVQLWTKSWYWWIFREAIGRIHHLVLRWV